MSFLDTDSADATDLTDSADLADPADSTDSVDSADLADSKGLADSYFNPHLDFWKKKTKLLYNAFINSQFNYAFVIWMFCRKKII